MHNLAKDEIEQLKKRRKELLVEKSAIDAELRTIDEKLSRVSPQSNQSKKARFISLFAKLFKGRHDVYAIRWESGANNQGRKRSGYNVACANKFKQGLCSKTLMDPSAIKSTLELPLRSAALNTLSLSDTLKQHYPQSSQATASPNFTNISRTTVYETSSSSTT